MKYKLKDSLDEATFRLISDAMERTVSEYSVAEVSKLLGLAESFLATGEAMDRISDIFVYFVCRNNFELEDISLSDKHVWSGISDTNQFSQQSCSQML